MMSNDHHPKVDSNANVGTDDHTRRDEIDKRGDQILKQSGSKTADSDTVSTYQVSSVQLVTDKKLEAFNKA